MNTNDTINAKQIRQDLLGFLRRVKSGRPITVIYRSKPFVTINDSSARPPSSEPVPGSPEAVKKSLAYAKQLRSGQKSVFDPHKSAKQLYHEMLDKDPKYGNTSRR